MPVGITHLDSEYSNPKAVINLVVDGCKHCSIQNFLQVITTQSDTLKLRHSC